MSPDPVEHYPDLWVEAEHYQRSDARDQRRRVIPRTLRVKEFVQRQRLAKLNTTSAATPAISGDG